MFGASVVVAKDCHSSIMLPDEMFTELLYRGPNAHCVVKFRIFPPSTLGDHEAPEEKSTGPV